MTSNNNHEYKRTMIHIRYDPLTKRMLPKLAEFNYTNQKDMISKLIYDEMNRKKFLIDSFISGDFKKLSEKYNKSDKTFTEKTKLLFELLEQMYKDKDTESIDYLFERAEKIINIRSKIANEIYEQEQNSLNKFI